jgi:hypothetical protein
VTEDRPPPEEQEETDRAAEEAARIGGISGNEEIDEAERGPAEHGGGEAEGFEQAEELLERHATHDDEHGGPLRQRPNPEPERDRAAHGEADRVDSTETELDTQGTDADPETSSEKD